MLEDSDDMLKDSVVVIVYRAAAHVCHSLRLNMTEMFSELREIQSAWLGILR